MKSSSIKIGDLVKLPEDNHYWWGGKAGIVVDVETPLADAPTRQLLRLIVAGENPGFTHVKFSANFVELINESR